MWKSWEWITEVMAVAENNKGQKMKRQETQTMETSTFKKKKGKNNNREQDKPGNKKEGENQCNTNTKGRECLKEEEVIFIFIKKNNTPLFISAIKLKLFSGYKVINNVES